MSRFLRDLALAHQKHEGWFHGSLSFRQNNPGNLKFQEFHKRYGATEGEKGFARFPTYGSGFRALTDDLAAKLNGNSRHEKLQYKNNPTFLDYVSVYAPPPANNPLAYTEALIRELPQYHLTPSTSLKVMAKLIEDENPKIEHTPAAKERLAKRLMSRFSGNALERLRNRLKAKGWLA